MSTPETPDPPDTEFEPSLVIGIGASAGGLDASQRFLRAAPDDKGVAYVFVLHLAPSLESHIASILKRSTSMPVTQVEANETVEPNHVYVIAPATYLRFREGLLLAEPTGDLKSPNRPIDALFTSLALELGKKAVGIVLSGSGSDGTSGLADIRSVGGLGLVQSPESAEFDAMPRSAIDGGLADLVLEPEGLGGSVLAYASAPKERLAGARTQNSPSEVAHCLPFLLERLNGRYRVDFREYKRGTLQRRTERRIELHRLPGWNAYADYVNAHPEELDELYRDFLVGVTSFFRDPAEWNLLSREIVPLLVENRSNNTAIRLWSAGCATGEEAYGLAMVFLEHLEKMGSRLNLKVFASDASEAALAIGRRGRYAPDLRSDVSAERLQRFFLPCDDGFEVERILRELITFASHDLLSDPPFAHLDLISCRNVLIYLSAPAQERLLELFHFALRPDGILWLGTSETIGRRSDLFREVSPKNRMYRAIATSRPARYRLVHPSRRSHSPLALSEANGKVDDSSLSRQLETLILREYALPGVVIDQAHQILYLFGPLDNYLKRPQGETRTDLFSWVRPEMYARLRNGLTEASSQRKGVTITGVRLDGNSESVRIEILIDPIASIPRFSGLTLIAFRDLPAITRTSADEARAGTEQSELSKQLWQELQETREELREAVDQLRVATEEHGASYEELLSLNEEFQSSNEELEASKEELQSLNEELTTINRQLEERNDELRAITADLNNLLVNTHVPILFLDREMRIRRFTPDCTALIHVVPADLGRHLSEIKMQVADPQLVADIWRVLSEKEPLEAEVASEQGRWYLRRVLPYWVEGAGIDGVCLTFHEITAQKQTLAKAENSRLVSEAILHISRTPLLVLDEQHNLITANAAFYESFGLDEKDTLGRKVFEIGERMFDLPRVRNIVNAALDGGAPQAHDFDHLFASIGWRSQRFHTRLLPQQGIGHLLLLSIEDVTELRRAELEAQSQAGQLQAEDQRKHEFLALLGHELRNPLAALSNGLELIRMTDGSGLTTVRGMMERQTRRMTAMLDQLLDVARVISGKFEIKREAADIAAAAKAAIESTEPMLRQAGHKLTVSLPPDGTVLVLGDAVRLAQVLENLIGNAVKYTMPNGQIWLTLDANRDTVTISVRDDGVGIEPEMIDHIFDLFTQGPVSLHRSKGGLGLGLPLVRSLVQVHGGGIEAFSEGKNRGTEVVITLPRLSRGILSPVNESAPRSPIRPRRILIVDDEEDAALALAEILTLHGHQTRTARDGMSALSILPSSSPMWPCSTWASPIWTAMSLGERFAGSTGTTSCSSP